jgi:hypothetical protein
VVELDWGGATAVIVASGPSAARTPIELAIGRAKIIAVNNSWRLAPFADVLFGCDAAWWFHHDGVREFAGHRVTCSPAACRRFGLEMFITRGSNSGIRAVRLAEHFGARSILLVGFDMHVAGGVHWHERHVGVLRNPTADTTLRWRAEIERDLRAGKFKARIINCTPGSALTCFPYLPFAEAIDGSHGEIRSDQLGHCARAG